MRAPLFIVRDSTILGSKADLRLPQAYRSLPRSSSLLEPSHPLGGLIGFCALVVVRSQIACAFCLHAHPIKVVYYNRPSASFRIWLRP
jgi:hypothetical protein